MYIRMRRKRHMPRKPRVRIFVIGIYHDEKGILVTRKDDGTFQLPGGIIWHDVIENPKVVAQQLKKEIAKISRTIFEKTGLSLDHAGAEQVFMEKIPDRVTKITRIYKVFIMEQNSTPGKPEWKRDNQVEGTFIPADLTTIFKRYPGLSYYDLHVLAIYLDGNTKQISKLQMRQKLRLIKSA